MSEKNDVSYTQELINALEEEQIGDSNQMKGCAIKIAQIRKRMEERLVIINKVLEIDKTFCA